MQKESSDICGQQRPRSACASAQSDQGLHYPLTESFDTTEYNNSEPRHRWLCACAGCEFAHFAHVRKHFRLTRPMYVFNYFFRAIMDSFVFEVSQAVVFSFFFFFFFFLAEHCKRKKIIISASNLQMHYSTLTMWPVMCVTTNVLVQQTLGWFDAYPEKQ